MKILEKIPARILESHSQNRSSLFVDTNVFIYAAGSDHPLRGPCATVLKLFHARKLDLQTSVEVLQELLYRYTSIKQNDKGIVLCREILALFNPVMPVSSRDLRLATDLLESYPVIDSRDAIHMAVAINNGIEHIVSTDRHFDLVQEIERVDPREFA